MARAIKRDTKSIFQGPPGVGKTQLAKVLAKNLFDSEDSLIRSETQQSYENIIYRVYDEIKKLFKIILKENHFSNITDTVLWNKYKKGRSIV
jgi:replication-associated recombination protein RarA